MHGEQTYLGISNLPYMDRYYAFANYRNLHTYYANEFLFVYYELEQTENLITHIHIEQ